MTHDPAKFPRARPLPQRRYIDVRVDLAEHRMRFSITDEAKVRYADELVVAKFDRGDYPEIQALDEATRKALVKQVLERLAEERRG